MFESSSIEITKAEISAIIEPWIIEKHSRHDSAWKAIRSREKARIYKKRLLRMIKSPIIPWIRSRTTHRTPEYVLDSYSQTWGRYRLPNSAEAPDPKKIRFLEWNDVGYVAPPFATQRCHLLGIAKAFQLLEPSSVLEVGAGPGINLFALASSFPEIEYTGIELTSAGVEAAVSIQEAPLPDLIGHIAPLPVKSRTAHQRISFTRGDVQDLPFPDQSFDTVFTRLAIEQMEQIRESALAEIYRVTKSHAVFVEPLADFNRDPLQALATHTKNYISLNAADFASYGFEPIFRFADWPQKITLGAGMIICRKV